MAVVPRSGPAAAPRGQVPLGQSRPDHGGDNLSRMPVAVASPQARDVPTFMEHLRAEGKPGLVSFAGNAYRVTIDGDSLTFFFDRSHANLIPMIKNPSQLGQLSELAKSFFKFSPSIHFAVGQDPKLVAKAAEEEKALQLARDNPTIQWLLQRFNAKIVSCQVMKQAEEE